MGRLVCVSNRVALPRKGEPAAGGLAVGLRSALKARGGLWFGWNGELGEVSGGTPQIQEADGITFATVPLKDVDYKAFYAGYANGTLWPLFHFRTGLLDYDRQAAAGYRRVNQAFAEALMPLLRPDDTVWVHDYQLIPLGQMLRKCGFRGRIGFFLHIPFPPWAVFSVLPEADQVLRELLAYDLVGVQTQRDLFGIEDCLRHGLDLEVGDDGVVHAGGRLVQVAAHPIGIEGSAFAATARRAVERAETKRLVQSLGGRALILGAERLDYTKGIPHRLRGFASLLRNHPELRNTVVFLQVAARSRNDVASYRDLRREIELLTARVNSEFGEPDWTPLRYVGRPVARNTLAGFYRAARIGLVTPLRDGMNLVAMEYVAAQDPEDPGVLVLSRFAGAAEVMQGALLVNPLDADAIGDALAQALRMPLEERKERWQAAMKTVRGISATSWADGFIQQLDAQPLAHG